MHPVASAGTNTSSGVFFNVKHFCVLHVMTSRKCLRESLCVCVYNRTQLTFPVSLSLVSLSVLSQVGQFSEFLHECTSQ